MGIMIIDGVLPEKDYIELVASQCSSHVEIFFNLLVKEVEEDAEDTEATLIELAELQQAGMQWF